MIGRALGSILTAILLLAGCVPASPDVGTYRDKAAVTLGAAISEVATVELVLETSSDGRMLRPAARTQLRYSEEALDTATGAFTELNPPAQLDGLFLRSGTLLDEASDVVAEARIAIERREVERYAALAKELKQLGTTLASLEGRVS